MRVDTPREMGLMDIVTKEVLDASATKSREPTARPDTAIEDVDHLTAGQSSDGWC
jgi:hypothetical protein